MIVYGDCPIQIKCNEFIRRFQRRVTGLPADLQELRVRLVLAGQLQQAAEDAGLSCAQRCSALTATAADAFVASALRRPPARHSKQAILRQLDAIEQLAPAHATLTIRTPEGFAWYALFPDAYAQAADAWVRGVPTDAAVMVVGIRSIGTTLAATVAAVLKAHCRQVLCVTVRPHGHPFNRKVTLPSPQASADYAIIVDEGPGLSGSSMVAVADAMVALGMPRGAITFFPGHGNGPGCEARAHVRRWWRGTPAQYVTWERLCFATRSAPQVLVDAAESLLVQSVRAPLIDFGAGQWRQCLQQRADDFFAVAPFLEQPKLLARAESGTGILFKFAGLALARDDGAYLEEQAQAQANRLCELAERDLTIAPRASLHGWLALPWLDGRRLRCIDMNASLFSKIVSYIQAVAGPTLSTSEREAAFSRLRQLLQHNTGILLGDAAAGRAARAGDRLARAIMQRELPSYGDGRLAPHEWIATAGGTRKLDAAGHHSDHSAIGPQPIWWDVAGAAIEWKLDRAAADKLEEAMQLNAPEHASYFRAAYSAFRAGIAKLAADIAGREPGQCSAFAGALGYYRRCLANELDRLEAQ